MPTRGQARSNAWGGERGLCRGECSIRSVPRQLYLSRKMKEGVVLGWGVSPPLSPPFLFLSWN